jgi:hypothetical protein
MSDLPATYGQGSVDLIHQANQFVLAILFTKSKSSVYPLALNVAKAASLYQEMELEGHVFHVAFFSAEFDAMKRALSLLNFARRIAHTQVYGRGQLITNPFRAASVIECYINSLKPADHRAHCFATKRYRDAGEKKNLLQGPVGKMLDIDLIDINIKLDGDSHIEGDDYGATSFVIPCSYITKFADFRLSSLVPASFVDQIKAAGAKCDCDWCPNFRPGDFKKL